MSSEIITRKAFVEDGFHKWQNAVSTFNNHQSTELHRNAIILTLTTKKPNILEHLSKAKQKEMLDNHVALYKIFTTIIFLEKQELALQGHEDKNSNLKQLLMLRCEDVPELKTWINRDSHKWLHNTIVNEIVSLIAHEIRKNIRRNNVS